MRFIYKEDKNVNITKYQIDKFYPFKSSIDMRIDGSSE